MSTPERCICVAICEKDADALIAAFRRTAQTESFVEIRLDCLNYTDLTIALERLRKSLKDFQVQTILTYRPREQGGLRTLSPDERRQFWVQHGFALPHVWFDLEIDLVENFLHAGDVPDWSRVICSAHDFSAGGNLMSLYDRLARTPARILKVAVMSDDATDNVEIFKLLERAEEDGRQLIAIGMGIAGIANRVLGPSRGSFLTYAAPDKDTATAPGQLTVAELRDLYRIEQITKETTVMGLIGHPIGHSLSPQIHNAAFGAAGLDSVYLPFDVRDLAAFMRCVVDPATREIDWKLRGLSVTTPHKRTVMDHLEWIEPAAKEIGAVNTVVIDGGQLRGYNTDAAGFVNALNTRIPQLKGLRCAVIGAGGAARAAIWALLQEGATVCVFARSVERAKALAEAFDITVRALQSPRFEGFDVVVNTTVLGMSGEFEQQTPAVAGQLRGARLAYDLVYNPTETRFLREASYAGCETLGGLSMFVGQAAEQFRLWTGVEAPIQVMEAAAVNALNQR